MEYRLRKKNARDNITKTDNRETVSPVPGQECPGDKKDVCDSHKDTDNLHIISPGQSSPGVENSSMNSDIVCFSSLEWDTSDMKSCCVGCGKTDLRVRWCKCRVYQYCSDDCFQRHWSVHEEDCEPLDESTDDSDDSEEVDHDVDSLNF